jgi:integrase
LALCTIYGLRASEVKEIGPGDIHLDGSNSYVMIRTLKGGVPRAQPIPEALVPIFHVPFEDRVWEGRLRREFHGLCKKAGVYRPKGASIHGLRRSVVTELYRVGLSHLSITKFMRWSSGRGMGVLPTYVKVPTEELDNEVLAHHPSTRGRRKQMCIEVEDIGWR